MIIHADTLPEGGTIEADVCVVGAGPVGLQIALRLTAAGLKVVVVESGEDWSDARAQDLNIGTTSGRWTGALRDIRIRRLGGTMHVWGGNCRPLDPMDFMPRPWVPVSGWPVSYADIAPYFEEAHAALALGDYEYRPEAPALRPTSAFEEILFRLSSYVPGPAAPYRGEFAQIHRAVIEGGANPHVLLGATVREVCLTEDRCAVAYLHALTFQGRELYLRGRAYVLACGGIETPRLLLASSDLAGGIGNAGGTLGRYFMEHPHGLAGLLLAREDAEGLHLFSPGLREDWGVVQRRLRLTDAVQAQEGLLNLSFQLVAEALVPGQEQAYEAEFRALEATVPDPGRWGRYYVVFLSEQEPRPDSRVTLGAERDFFGMPRPDLHWSLSDLDLATVERATRKLEAEVFTGERFRFHNRVPMDLENWHVGWGAHHMGTTRMSADPRMGVVDRDCRIHGIANAFVAGSSVFPTAGMANPLLASLALGLRLARHLQGVLPYMDVPAMPSRLHSLAAA